MSIVIGGDFMPTSSNIELFSDGKLEELVGKELINILKKSDFCIFNLEGPLCGTGMTPSMKHGPNLCAPQSTALSYSKLGVDLLTLANNHIMDYGEKGLKLTIEALEDNGINYVGIGKDVTEAAKPFIFEFAGKNVGVYACAEHEFSVAENAKAGANPFDELESFDQVKDLKQLCDYVIVLYHGGKEHYRYPSPQLQKICRKFIDKGANIVICQHSHCIGAMEEYSSGTIVYGQGNFLFDLKENEFWDSAILVEIDGEFEVSYIPVVKKGNGVRLATDSTKKEILNTFESRSNDIKKIGFIESKYTEYSEEMFEFYMESLGANKRKLMWRIIDKLLNRKLTKWWISKKYKNKNLYQIVNYIECETHRELLLYAIKNKLESRSEH